MTRKTIFSLPLLISILALSACAGGAKQQPQIASTMNPQLKTNAIDRAMETALANAEAAGDAQEVLAMLAQVHARSPKDPIVATRYARALRDDEQINAAIRTLEPFTKGKDPSIEAITEMAMTQLSLGDFEAAESYAVTATEMNPTNARAYLALGTAQDAQGRHQDAEVSFREGVKHWKGDPSPILNNLALNLASQGHLEESLALIKKAQDISPNRMELERNRRIIATLLETTGPRPPAPGEKPVAETENKNTETETKKATAPKPPRKEIAKKAEEKEQPEEVKETAETKEAKETAVEEIEPAASEEKTEAPATYQGVPKMKTNIKLKPVE